MSLNDLLDPKFWTLHFLKIDTEFASPFTPQATVCILMHTEEGFAILILNDSLVTVSGCIMTSHTHTFHF